MAKGYVLLDKPARSGWWRRAGKGVTQDFGEAHLYEASDVAAAVSRGKTVLTFVPSEQALAVHRKMQERWAGPILVEAKVAPQHTAAAELLPASPKPLKPGFTPRIAPLWSPGMTLWAGNL